MSGKCAIFGGGDPVSSGTVSLDHTDEHINIAADSGYLLAERLGISLDLIIGDFDSAEKPQFKNVKVYPVEKDDTDLMLAVKEGLARGCDSIVIYGATGGRLDHTYAAIQSLAYLLDHGAQGVIVSDNERIELLDRGEYFYPAAEGMTLSLFAFSDKVEGLTVHGAKYEAEDVELSSGFPLGVSNSVSDGTAEIGFKSGRLLVIRSKL